MPTVPSIRAAALLLACAALALPLAACGSSGGGGGAGLDADNARDTAQLKLQECLKEQGVAPPERRTGSGGDGGVEVRRPSDAEVEKLQDALEGPCKDEQEAAFGSISEEDRAKMEDARIRMTACLREHGVEMPEPDGDGPVIMRLDARDDELQQAMDACRDELPEELRGGPGRGPVFFGGARR